MEESQAPAVVNEEEKPQLVASPHTFGGLVPRNLDELWRMSNWIVKSGWAPKDMRTPESCAVAIQMGLEVGLKPLQAIQNIAVINGRPSIWGDLALALVRGSGELEYFKEWREGEPFTDGWTAYCELRRTGDEENTVESFSYKEAKAAKLVPAHQDSPWTKYPQRMLKMRARSWALRDKFTDVLKGLSVREEASDVVYMRPAANGTFEAAPEKVPAKEALKRKLKGEPAEKPPERAEDGPEIVPEDKTPSDTPQPDSAQNGPSPASPVVKDGEVAPPAVQTHEETVESQAREYEIFSEFKTLKKPGFIEWLVNNIDKRHTWTLFISRAVDTKCKTLFEKTLDEVLPELESFKSSSPSSSKAPPPPDDLPGKIARIEDLLNEKYADIALTTKYEWMQASWEVDLDEMRNRITDNIAEQMLTDLSDPVRSTLTSFAKM